jgi:hypothetical protein
VKTAYGWGARGGRKKKKKKKGHSFLFVGMNPPFQENSKCRGVGKTKRTSSLGL